MSSCSSPASWAKREYLSMTDDEFVAGYRDGRNPDAPAPSDNRSHRYAHSFAIGRAEIEGRFIHPDVARAAATIAGLKDQAA